MLRGVWLPVWKPDFPWSGYLHLSPPPPPPLSVCLFAVSVSMFSGFVGLVVSFFFDENILLNQRGGMLKMLFKEKQSLIALICASIRKEILTKLSQYSFFRHGFSRIECTVNTPKTRVNARFALAGAGDLTVCDMT